MAAPVLTPVELGLTSPFSNAESSKGFIALAESSENSDGSQKLNAQPATPAAPVYCIVLASQVKLSNAEQYVEQLKSRGMQDAEVYIHNHIVRVIYGSYESESEAYRHLNKLNKHDEFAEAWVYKKSA